MTRNPEKYLLLTPPYFCPRAFAAERSAVPVDTAGFDKNVKPILKNTCTACHNATGCRAG